MKYETPFRVMIDGVYVGTYYDPKIAAKEGLSRWYAFGCERDEHDVDILNPLHESVWNYCMECLEPEPDVS